MLKNKIKVLITALFCFIFLNNIYAKSDTTYDELRKMIDIMEIVDDKYVEERENKDLVIGAIKGLVRTLDPYSQYMTEKDYKDMKTETKGSFGGVGIRITTQNNELTVVTPMPDTPAYYAGILPDDKIIKIDDKSTQDITSDEAVKLMRGNPGTKVVLTIYRPSTKEELTFTIIRKKIKIETVKKKMLDGNIGYIRLSEFNAQSSKDISDALKSLSKDGMKALVFDLRNNPGGLLDSAISICGLFIKEESLVVSTKCKDKTMEQYYYTQKKPDFPDLPVIVLINRGSASASEIVTGTLQDYKRALVIGSNSFGKGTVQTIIPLADGSALRLTIAKYCLPSGKMITHSDNKKDKKNGVTPDIYIEVSPETEGKLYMQSESEDTPKKKGKKEEKEEIKDEVLEIAKKIINADKINEYIEKPSKYEQDFSKEKVDKKEDKEENSKKQEDNSIKEEK
ncbi:MAG: S41 family peptidase [Endomicrobiaceae bacterium]|nr:S41 family peptidase [Endomicrobiaceae bacterium]